MDSNLTPYLWNAPLKPYHLKPVNAECVIAGKTRKSHIYVCHGCGELVAYARRNGEQYLCDVKASRRYRSRVFEFQPSMRHSRSCTPLAANVIHPTALEYIYQQEQLFERAHLSPFTQEQTFARRGAATVVDVESALDWEMDLALGRARDDERGI